jgi:Na+-driven multidrug efflux pump
MHKNALVTMTMVGVSILHVVWGFYFVHCLELGVQGVGIATMISYVLSFIIITIFCLVISEFKESFFFITKESINEGKREFLKIAIPSITMIVLEWGALEALSLIASIINIDAIGA